MGVGGADFWSLTPHKLMPYAKAYEKKRRIRMEEINSAAWMEGIYMSYCLASALGERNIYPDKPLAIFENEEEQKERKRREAEAFSAYAAVFNRDFRERRG